MNEYKEELLTNISRCIRHMGDMLVVGDDRDSRLLDMLDHMEIMVQEIQNDEV